MRVSPFLLAAPGRPKQKGESCSENNLTEPIRRFIEAYEHYKTLFSSSLVESADDRTVKHLLDVESRALASGKTLSPVLRELAPAIGYTDEEIAILDFSLVDGKQWRELKAALRRLATMSKEGRVQAALQGGCAEHGVSKAARQG